MIPFDDAVSSICATLLSDEAGKNRLKVSAALIMAIDSMADMMALKLKTTRLSVSDNGTALLPADFSEIRKVAMIVDNERLVQLVTDSDIRVLDENPCACKKNDGGVIEVSESCSYHTFHNCEGRPLYGYRKQSMAQYRVNKEHGRLEFSSLVSPGQSIFVEYLGSFDDSSSIMIRPKYLTFFGYKVLQLLNAGKNPGISAYNGQLANEEYNRIKRTSIEFDYYELIGALHNTQMSAPKYP